MSRRLLAGVFVLALIAAGSVGGVTGSGETGVRTNDATAASVESPPAVVQSPPTVPVNADAPARGDALRPVVDRAERRQDPEDCNYRRLYDGAARSVVAINTSNETGPVGGGSGWVYRLDDSTAYVVTNWHVVFGATEFDVQFEGRKWRKAELVGADLLTDLAVLRVENAPNSTASLELARERADHGQSVAVLGNPFGLEESISTGIVSGVERAVTVRYPHNLSSTIPDTIQVDAAVNPGNSGGPLVNCQGRVLGVNYAGVGPTSAGVNFAISTTVVREVVPALVEDGSYRHSFVGIRPVEVNPVIAEANELNRTRGVVVADVLPGGPADGALRGAPAVHRETGAPYGGDVIVAMNETRIDDREDLLTYLLLETDPGDAVEITVVRDGENRTVEVTLGLHPASAIQPPRTTSTTTTTTTETTTTETTTPTIGPAANETATDAS